MRSTHFYDLGTVKNALTSPEWQKFLNDLNKTPDTPRVPFKELFEETGITALDDERAGLIDRNKSVARSIETSLSELSEEEQSRFAELAVFELNEAVSTATLELYWGLTGNFSKTKTERFCHRLYDLSLVYYFDVKYSTIVIPQGIHHFLHARYKNEITKFRHNLLTCLAEF